MIPSGFFELMGFGPGGWGLSMLRGAATTLAVALAGFLLGLAIGGAGAFAKVAGGPLLRAGADVHTTVLRGIPDLLVIYLFYFGGSGVVTSIDGSFINGFVGNSGCFGTGVLS